MALLGEYIRQLRLNKRMSLRTLAKLSGVSNSEISRIETGSRKMPSPIILKKIAPHLGVMTENLLEKSGYLKKETVENTPSALERCPALAKAVASLDDCEDDQLQEIARFIEVFRKTHEMHP